MRTALNVVYVFGGKIDDDSSNMPLREMLPCPRLARESTCSIADLDPRHLKLPRDLEHLETCGCSEPPHGSRPQLPYARNGHCRGLIDVSALL